MPAVPHLRRLVAPALVIATLYAPPVAHAHGVGGVSDLPLPGWLLAWGVCLVLVASFGVLAAYWPQPRLERPRERRLLRFPAWLEPICGAVGVALFCLVVATGLFGSQVPFDNLAPAFVYAAFWVGLALLSAVLGDVFRPFNPWLTVARLIPGKRAAPYPEWLGYWPAAAGLLAFGWLELCSGSSDDPSTLAALALLYAAVQVAALWRWGDAWSRRGDAFGVYFALMARLAPLTVRDRVLLARPPLAGAPRLRRDPGVVALLCVALGCTTFDGITNDSAWPATPSIAVSTLGLLAAVGLVASLYGAGIHGMARADVGPPRELAQRFVHSLIPIALAYVVAHYLSLVLSASQSLVALASDPFGTGADLFGTADLAIRYDVLSREALWGIQVAALLAGHVAGLVLAHDRALTVFRATRDAVRSQYWMLAVMVGFTSLGLWLLAAAA